MKDLTKVLESLELQLKGVNRKVFNLRVKTRRSGLNNQDRYNYRVLRLKQKALKRQIEGLNKRSEDK